MMTDPVVAVIAPDLAFLTTINETLAQSGYIAILSQGDPDTPHLIQREQPSAIIIDVEMCDSGQASSVVESVMVDASEHDVPMLVTGGDATIHYESLAKPINPDELQEKLAWALASTMSDRRS
jgi:DNA-binding NtrC family response regulator